MLRYSVWADGGRKTITLPYDLTHAAFLVSYTLKGGRVTDAVLEPNQEAEITAAYRAWRNA